MTIGSQLGSGVLGRYCEIVKIIVEVLKGHTVQLFRKVLDKLDQHHWS